MTHLLRLFKILTITFFLASCSGNRVLAPVDTLQQPPSYKITSHTVAAGETLYAIAWRYTLDVNELARLNGIRQPYTLYPGQKLKIDLHLIEATPSRSQTVNRDTVTIRSRNGPKNAPSKDSPHSKTAQLRWRWPVAGRVEERFSGSGGLNKGIDIGAKKGDPVLAAESGEVVYAGSGLRGYGKLLIIKHDENYLSAYAHNQRLLAAEGETVKAGQQVAEIGSSGTNRYKLHFEIRYNGKPVDPLGYLPPR